RDDLVTGVQTCALPIFDFNLLAGLGVLERDHPDVRQDLFAFVLNFNRDEIMSATADRERARKIRRLKIGNEEEDGTARYDFVQEIGRASCRERVEVTVL